MAYPNKYQPPYTISAEILNRVAAISEAIGRLTVLTDQNRTLRLRRINRIRTIRSPLAIEGNTLSEAQIAAIFDNQGMISDAVTSSTPQVAPQVTPQVRALLLAVRGAMSRETSRLGAFGPQILPCALPQAGPGRGVD
jgi:Fic family protein